MTLLLTRLDPRARTLAYASAGHVTGYVLDRSGEVREELKSTGIPLGMFAEHAFPSGPTLSLEPDEIVVLFTDGVTEAGESHGGAFGADRLLDFIRSHRHDPASRIAEDLCQTAQSLQDDTPQIDDMTVVICKVEPHLTTNGA
jgi:sigma-B regulation protein RsbU (phosphoserine phosphatase)